jgi:hypothetical protein
MSCGVPKADTRYWVDPLGYTTHLPEPRKPPWGVIDDWGALESASRICIDPNTQHRRTIVLCGKPKPEQVRGFVELLREIYNSPTRTWLGKNDAVVMFYMDTGDTYLGVKVAASLCGLRWRHR